MYDLLCENECKHDLFLPKISNVIQKHLLLVSYYLMIMKK